MKYKKSEQRDSKLFAFLAVLLSVVGFIIALIAKKDNKYVIFYAKQSLILFVTGIVVKVLTVLLVLTIIGILAVPVLWVMYFIIWVIALINSLSGQEKETPIVGHYARSIDL
ncbi:DUF4870 domain-containing protein [Candidatus Pacearchaeota archaeon]|nr:DUF4870 domain-containing protein [Candidatus Pacearchaeota archaeon]